MGKYYSVIMSDDYLAHAVGIKAVHNAPLNSDVSSPRANYNSRDDKIHVDCTIDGNPTEITFSGYSRTASGGISLSYNGLDFFINTIKRQGNAIASNRGYRMNWDDARLRQMAKNMQAQVNGVSADLSTYGRVR